MQSECFSEMRSTLRYVQWLSDDEVGSLYSPMPTRFLCPGYISTYLLLLFIVRISYCHLMQRFDQAIIHEQLLNLPLILQKSVDDCRLSIRSGEPQNSVGRSINETRTINSRNKVYMYIDIIHVSKHKFCLMRLWYIGQFL